MIRIDYLIYISYPFLPFIGPFHNLFHNLFKTLLFDTLFPCKFAVKLFLLVLFEDIDLNLEPFIALIALNTQLNIIFFLAICRIEVSFKPWNVNILQAFIDLFGLFFQELFINFFLWKILKPLIFFPLCCCYFFYLLECRSSFDHLINRAYINDCLLFIKFVRISSKLSIAIPIFFSHLQPRNFPSFYSQLFVP